MKPEENTCILSEGHQMAIDVVENRSGPIKVYAETSLVFGHIG